MIFCLNAQIRIWKVILRKTRRDALRSKAEIISGDLVPDNYVSAFTDRSDKIIILRKIKTLIRSNQMLTLTNVTIMVRWSLI